MSVYYGFKVSYIFPIYSLVMMSSKIICFKERTVQILEKTEDL